MKKKYTELEDKLILDSIPENGIFTKELAITLKKQLPDRSIRSIEVHWYNVLREKWLENKVKEAEAKAETVESKHSSFWRKLINLFKSK